MKKTLTMVAVLALVACANRSYYQENDVYYDDQYYANDYDPYYGYSDSDGQYTTDGSGLYYNNYNYYPDRWGINYSNVFYSPYRYPRIGFFYDDCWIWAFNCYHSWSLGYSYWGVSSWYHDRYWWNNHWFYPHYYIHPNYSRYGRYSSRREASRLANRDRNSYKDNRVINHGNQPRYGTSRTRTRYGDIKQPGRVLKQPRLESPVTRPDRSRNEARVLGGDDRISQKAPSSNMMTRKPTAVTTRQNQYNKPVQQRYERYGQTRSTSSDIRSNQNQTGNYQSLQRERRPMVKKPSEVDKIVTRPQRVKKSQKVTNQGKSDSKSHSSNVSKSAGSSKNSRSRDHER